MSTFAALVFAVIVAAPGDPPLVKYAAKVVTKSWEPIALKEVERMVESKALAVLTKPGTMRLEKSGYADLASGDYALTIDGRFIEEAESFSVYLGFGKGRKDDLPSFNVADTVALAKLDRAKMQQRIEAMAARAGERLVEVLAPRLEAARLAIPPPAIESPELPVEWGAVEIPRVSSPSKAIRTLLDPRSPDHERHRALTELQGQVFDQQPPRNAVERCVVSDPTPELRARCADVLEAVSRAHVPTQRVLLAAMRREVDERVLGTLTKISTAFVGLSRKEALATWLELVVSEATPGSSASNVAQLLAEEDDVPNLDIAVAACLRQQALAYGKKSACAQWLLRKVPEPRRLAVVAPYLRSVRVWDTGENNVYGDVVQEVPGRGSKPIDPALAAIFLEIAERPSAGRARRDALYQLTRHPAPTPEVMQRLLRLVPEPHLATSALRAIHELAERTPALAPMTAGALERLRETVRYLPEPHTENPYRAIDETITRLRKSASK